MLTSPFRKDLFNSVGARNSKLRVTPLNQGKGCVAYKLKNEGSDGAEILAKPLEILNHQPLHARLVSGKNLHYQCSFNCSAIAPGHSAQLQHPVSSRRKDHPKPGERRLPALARGWWSAGREK
jgi:hypothetical protein